MLRRGVFSLFVMQNYRLSYCLLLLCKLGKLSKSPTADFRDVCYYTHWIENYFTVTNNGESHCVHIFCNRLNVSKLVYGSRLRSLPVKTSSIVVSFGHNFGVNTFLNKGDFANFSTSYLLGGIYNWLNVQLYNISRLFVTPKQWSFVCQVLERILSTI